MRFRLTTVLFVLLPLLSAAAVYAETAPYSAGGTPVPTNLRSGALPPAAVEKKTPTTQERMALEAEEAAANGFMEGETVKVVDGIIYRLYKDPDTGRYTFKLFRKVKKTVPSPGPDQPAAVTAPPPVASPKREPEPLTDEALKKEPVSEAGKPVSDGAGNPDGGEAVKPDSGSSWFRRSGEDAESESSGVYNVLDSYLGEGVWALEARHSFFERQTVLNKRTVTTETGSAADVNGVGVEDLFSTRMHEDDLFLRYGVTDTLELYLKAGLAYASFSDAGDMGLCYGAGFKILLYQYEVAEDSRLYLDLAGAYSGGSLNDEYTDTLGATYKKDTDFTEMEAGFGGRWVIRRLALYGSCSVLSYTEDTVRTQVLQAPDKYVLTDELEQQLSAEVMGGVNYRLTDHLDVYMEYHLLNREGAVAGMAYRF